MLINFTFWYVLLISYNHMKNIFDGKKIRDSNGDPMRARVNNEKGYESGSNHDHSLCWFGQWVMAVKCKTKGDDGLMVSLPLTFDLSRWCRELPLH